MKSPFPGMDPYLEAFWGDVHTSLVTYARDQLRTQMPQGLRVRVEEHISVEVAGEGNLALAEPLIVPLDTEAETQRSLQIIDTHSGNRVITALEILSPSNKADRRGQGDYRRKQDELRRGRVSLVEIDLLRAGGYVLAVPAHVVPLTYLSPYRICVTRASRPSQAEVYRTSLRERLPAIRVPLRENDPDARLDLQELIDKSYESGDYGFDIDYRKAPVPPLQGDDADWADALLREKGLRP